MNSLQRGVATCAVLAACVLAGPTPAARAQGYGIGHTTLTFTDPSRGNRAIPSEVYFPTGAPGGVQFPVVSVGHGYQMTVGAYGYLWQALVPRGYIVVLPTTGGELFPDHLTFGRDLAAAITGMRAQGGSPTSPFYGRVAATSAIAGHSMGGGCSVLGVAYDAQITAYASLAAAETNPSAIAAAASVSLPSLVFAGSDDCVAPPAQHQRPIYDALASSCKTYIEETGGSHCQFADYNLLCSLGEFCSAGMTRAEQHALTLSLLQPWLDYWLKGDGAAWAAFASLYAAADGFLGDQRCDALTAVSPPGAIAGAVRAQPSLARSSTTLTVAAGAGAAHLEAIDLAGRVVRRWPLAAGEGATHIKWDLRGENGSRLPAGRYLLRLGGAHHTTTSLLILR